MRSEKADPIAALRDKYDIVESEKSWTLACKHCPKAWRLVKPTDSAPMHPGNVLALLLNHAASHR